MRTPDGTTVFGRLYRMPRPDLLDEEGWRQCEAAGVSTLVDLRNADEIPRLPLRPSSITSINTPIEDPLDSEFMARWGSELGSPAYYVEALTRWPGKFAAVIRAISDAPRGGVVIHCAAGRDRTGLVVALILTLCDVDLDLILDDYEAGVRETNVQLRSQDDPHESPRTDRQLEESIAQSRATLRALLIDLDVRRYLLESGCSPSQVDGVRSRLTDRESA